MMLGVPSERLAYLLHTGMRGLDFRFFEWAFLGTCVALPSIAWYAANRAVDEAIRKGSPHVHDQGLATGWEDEPWYVTEEEAIRAHAITEKKPDDQGK